LYKIERVIAFYNHREFTKNLRYCFHSAALPGIIQLRLSPSIANRARANLRVYRKGVRREERGEYRGKETLNYQYLWK